MKFNGDKHETFLNALNPLYKPQMIEVWLQGAELFTDGGLSLRPVTGHGGQTLSTLVSELLCILFLSRGFLKDSGKPTLTQESKTCWVIRATRESHQWNTSSGLRSMTVPSSILEVCHRVKGQDSIVPPLRIEFDLMNWCPRDMDFGFHLRNKVSRKQSSPTPAAWGDWALPLHFSRWPWANW